MARTGRPPEPVPQDIADALVEWISEGKTLRAFCRQPGMPKKSALYEWMEGDSEFAGRVARARDQGFEALAQETLAIADDGTNDWMHENAKDSIAFKLNGEHVQRSKLRIETRLKLLACWDPRRYGNKGDGQTETAEALAKLVLQQIDGARAATPLGDAAPEVTQ